MHSIPHVLLRLAIFVMKEIISSGNTRTDIAITTIVACMKRQVLNYMTRCQGGKMFSGSRPNRPLLNAVEDHNRMEKQMQIYKVTAIDTDPNEDENMHILKTFHIYKNGDRKPRILHIVDKNHCCPNPQTCSYFCMKCKNDDQICLHQVLKILGKFLNFVSLYLTLSVSVSVYIILF